MDELNSIKQKINHALCRYNGSDHIITVEEMKKAISKLRGEKSDGDGQLWSNHIIYAPNELSVHLSVLMTGIIVHGYNPTDLLLGTLISLPNDKHGNMCDSDNYRGICLCSCITKLLEWCMLIRYNKKLETSGLQFSFKAGHSTVMSSLAMKEVINYYWNRHSKVYVALIDASKAFDRVRYHRLFDLLYKRSIPPIILRTIMDMYERQESRASWENIYGN